MSANDEQPNRESGVPEHAPSVPPDAEAAQSPESEGAELGQRAGRAGLWTMIAFGGQQALRLLSNIILTRMMFAEAFGLMALVSVFNQGLILFSDIGINVSIIQNPRGKERRFLDTAWTIQVIRGVVLWVIALAAAFPFARAYDAELLKVVIPVSAFGVLLLGFNSTKLATLNRSLAMGRLAMLELGTQVLSIITMVVWAYLSPTIWALVAGGLVAGVAKLILSHTSLPGKNNRFDWDKSAAHEIFTFGRWIFVSTLMGFLANQSDKLVFGKLLSLGDLGVYHIAMTIASVPLFGLNHLASMVLFPMLSRAAEGNNFGESFRRMRRPVLLAGGWVLSGFIAGGQVIIDILYDSRYREAGWIMVMLSFGNWLALIESTVLQALLARGRSKWMAVMTASRAIAIPVFVFTGYHFYDFQGAVLGFALSQGAGLPVAITAARADGIRGMWLDLPRTAWVLASALIGYFACQLVPREGDELGMSLVAALVVFVTVTACWAPAGFMYLKSRHKQPPATEA